MSQIWKIVNWQKVEERLQDAIAAQKKEEEFVRA